MSKLRAVFAFVCTCFYLYNNNLINKMEKFVIFAFRQDKNHTKKLYFMYADAFYIGVYIPTFQNFG